MADELSIAIDSRQSEIPSLIERIADYYRERGCPKLVQHELELLLEEWLTNVVSYGYPSGKPGRITVQAALCDGNMELRIVDDGVPFDPRQAPVPDLSLPLEQRPIGGLGLHLIRELVDQIEYERRDGTNQLLLRKALTIAKLDTQAGPPGAS